ncbi:ribonuclease P protein component [Balneolaceae bacterium ANBcel3]|nr:ribonuclease P protein component [Balneolaceae bacterium ANBcel3]
MKYSVSSLSKDCKLPRSRILRGRESIQRLFRTGKALKEQHLDMRYLIFPGSEDACQMAFITGKKLGKAHRRNLLRRRMKEAYRKHQHLIRNIALAEQLGFHGILIAKKADIPYRIIEKECINLLTLAAKAMKKGGTD